MTEFEYFIFGVFAVTFFVLVFSFLKILSHQKRIIDRLTDQLLSRNLPEFVSSQKILNTNEPDKQVEKRKTLYPVDSVLGGKR